MSANPNQPLTPAAVLENLCRTIESTGGVVLAADGTFHPLGDEDWIDLGDCYIDACRVLNREPKIENDEPDEPDEDDDDVDTYAND